MGFPFIETFVYDLMTISMLVPMIGSRIRPAQQWPSRRKSIWSSWTPVWCRVVPSESAGRPLRLCVQVDISLFFILMLSVEELVIFNASAFWLKGSVRHMWYPLNCNSGPLALLPLLVVLVPFFAGDLFSWTYWSYSITIGWGHHKHSRHINFIRKCTATYGVGNLLISSSIPKIHFYVVFYNP